MWLAQTVDPDTYYSVHSDAMGSFLKLNGPEPVASVMMELRGLIKLCGNLKPDLVNQDGAFAACGVREGPFV
jgi:hypothetical protein